MTDLARNELRHRLSQVIWIGGPPDSGKTSVATAIGQKFGLTIYHFDRHEPAHFARADPRRHPALYAAHPERMTSEERWLGTSPAAMAQATIRSWTERFDMAVDDLLELAWHGPVIAEGPGLFPDCVAPLLFAPSQAVWLLPTHDFKLASVARRDKPGSRWETSDPERAQQNLIERDLLMGAHIERRVAALGLTLYRVDGSQSLEALAEGVETQLRPWLPAREAAGRVSGGDTPPSERPD